MTDEIKPCIHAEVCAEGCDLEDITECGYYRAERTCRNVYEGREFKCSSCGTQWHLVYRAGSGDEWAHIVNPAFCPSCGAKVAR